MPWAIYGFDKTTEHRLRISGEYVLDLLANSPFPYILLSGDILENLRTFFSIREYDQLEHLLLYPFLFQNNVLSFLLVSSSAVIFQDTINIPSYMPEISQKCAEILYNSREKKIEKYHASQGTIPLDDPEDFIQRSYEIIQKGKSTLFFTISIDKIINSIGSSSFQVDTYRIRQDLYHILSAMISDNGFLTLINVSTLAVLFAGTFPHDEDLILHQISLSMQDLYDIKMDISSCVTGIMKNPSEKKEIVVFIKNRT